MLNLYYREAAISAITGFIRAYEEAFFELYQDSGLVTERVILENYRLSAKKLSKQIFLEIEKHLVKKAVLGRKESEHWHELTFYTGSRLITVYYTTDKIDGSRTVQTIGIERKPIIF